MFGIGEYFLFKLNRWILYGHASQIGVYRTSVPEYKVVSSEQRDRIIIVFLPDLFKTKEISIL